MQWQLQLQRVSLDVEDDLVIKRNGTDEGGARLGVAVRPEPVAQRRSSVTSVTPPQLETTGVDRFDTRRETGRELPFSSSFFEFFLNCFHHEARSRFVGGEAAICACWIAVDDVGLILVPITRNVRQFSGWWVVCRVISSNSQPPKSSAWSNEVALVRVPELHPLPNNA